MNNAVELNDQELEAIVGGYNYHNHGVNVNVDTNIAVPINLNVSPTVNVAVLSKNVSQSGSNNSLANWTGQNIN
jgi:hypothetical protein